MRKISLTYHLNRVSSGIKLSPIDQITYFFFWNIENSGIKHSAFFCGINQSSTIFINSIVMFMRHFKIIYIFSKKFIKCHSCHRCSNRTHLLDFVIKPSTTIQILIIYKNKSNFIALRISKNTSLNILTKIFHSFSHRFAKNFVEWFFKSTSKGMKCFAVQPNSNWHSTN